MIKNASLRTSCLDSNSDPLAYQYNELRQGNIFTHQFPYLSVKDDNKLVQNYLWDQIYVKYME